LKVDRRGRHLLRAVIDHGDLLPAASLEFQRLDDEAFEAIQAELDGSQLAPRQQTNALRGLSLLSKEFLPHRKEEVLDRALALATTENREVRSAAVHMAIWTTYILEGLGRPSPRQRAQVVVRQAIDLGLDPEQARLAQGFLRNDPPDIDIIEVTVKS
jgi:hypothetical protein